MKRVFLLVLILLINISCADATVLEFAQITDIHISLKQDKYNKRDLGSSVNNLSKAIKLINEDKKIKFVVFTGDVINGSQTEELELFFETVSALKKPYYVVMGNHDAYSMSGIPKEEFLGILATYNPNQTQQEANVCIPVQKGVDLFIVDNTSTRIPTSKGYYSSNTLKWLDKTLKEHKNDLVIIAQHSPIIDPSDNPSHSLREKESIQEILDKSNNVKLVISGHFHESAENIDKNGVTHYSTAALYDKPPRYRIISMDYSRRPFKKPVLNKITTEIKTLK